MRRVIAMTTAMVIGTSIASPKTAFADTTSPTPTPESSPIATAPSGVQLGPTLPSGPSNPPLTQPPGQPTNNDPGFFDIVGHIEKAINDWFRTLVTSALDGVLGLLGQTILATPDMTGPGQIHDLWGMAAGIANALFILFALAGGAVVMGHETVQTRYSAKDIAPRLVLAVIASNASLSICGTCIQIANSLAQAFLGQGVGMTQVTDSLHQIILSPLDGGGVFLILFALVVVVFAIILLAIYVVRVVLMVLLIVGAPVALAAHALPQTDGLARLWWRALLACLAIQVGQSLVLVTALRVIFTNDGSSTLGLSGGSGLVNLLVSACLLWVLIRIPVWAGRAAFGGGNRHGTVMQTAKHVVVTKAIKAGITAL